MKTKEEYKKCINRFLNQFFPHAYSVMVTGSFVTEYFNEKSDIDLIIITNLYRNIFVETYNFEDEKIQIIMFPLFDLESVLIKDVTSGSGVYLDQLVKGIIIKDTNDIMRKLKIKAYNLYIQGPHPFTMYSFCQLRSRITTRIEDIEGNDNFDENIFTLIDTMYRVVDLYFQKNNMWSSKGKSASRSMKKSNPQLHNSLLRSITSFH